MSWLSRLNHGWRVIATGIAFASFGLGGMFLSATLFPLAALTSPDAQTTKRRVQRLMSASWRLFVWFMKLMGILTWEVHGREKLQQRGQLIVANHPSLLDVVFLISLIPEIDCVVKRAIFTNRFLRKPATWAGYIAERSAEELIGDCSATIRAGHSLLIFPEGTRTVPGQPISMRRGAAQMALAARCPLRPVTLSVSPPTLIKGQPWYHVPPRRFRMRIDVGEPIAIEPYLALEPSLAARHLTRDLELYFTRSLQKIGDPAHTTGVAATV
jgi:1-acyl-sn-glycerol-3-phosphate acyltransferase